MCGIAGFFTHSRINSPEQVLQAMTGAILPDILSGYRGVSYQLSGEQEQRAESIGGLLQLVPVASIATVLSETRSSRPVRSSR